MKKTLVSLLFLMVLGVPARGDQARYLSIRAEAEQGDAKAQNKLGAYYQLGLNVEQDDIEAVKWFRLAAVQGEGEAQFNLGEMYENGRGVSLDKREALDWYRKSCDNGCKCGCRSYRILRKELEFDPLP